MSYKVSTMKPSKFDQRTKGNYFVSGVNTNRTYTDHAGAVDHATNLIYAGNADEFLIVKVVGRVRKKRPPVEYIEVNDQ